MHLRKLVLVCLALVLFAAACGSSGEETVAEGDANASASAEQTASDSAPAADAPAVDGEWLTPFDPANDPSVGAAAPDINIISLTSDPITIDQADGRGKVYGFFAHWCPHCQAELPVLTSYIDANGLPDGVDFHAVSTAVDAERPNYPPVAWFADEGWPFDVLSDTNESEIAQAFGLTGFPYFVVVGGDGTVVERVAGGLPDEAAFAALLNTAAQSAR